MSKENSHIKAYQAKLEVALEMTDTFVFHTDRSGNDNVCEYVL